MLSILESQVLSVMVYEQVSLSKCSPSATGPDTHLRQGGTWNLEMCSLIITFWFVLRVYSWNPRWEKHSAFSVLKSLTVRANNYLEHLLILKDRVEKDTSSPVYGKEAEQKRKKSKVGTCVWGFYFWLRYWIFQNQEFLEKLVERFRFSTQESIKYI